MQVYECCGWVHVCVLGPPSGEAVAILIVLSSNVVFVKLYHASELELENFLKYALN